VNVPISTVHVVITTHVSSGTTVDAEVLDSPPTFAMAPHEIYRVDTAACQARGLGGHGHEALIAITRSASGELLSVQVGGEGSDLDLTPADDQTIELRLGYVNGGDSVSFFEIDSPPSPAAHRTPRTNGKTDTTTLATATLTVRLELDASVDPAKVNMADLRTVLQREVARLDGALLEVEYDRPNDRNAYATVEIESCEVESIVPGAEPEGRPE
jgi:hypothetical protein